MFRNLGGGGGTLRKVYIIGVGMTPFGRWPDESIKSLVSKAVGEAFSDGGIEKHQVEAAWFSNCTWGYFSGQDCIRGQVALRPLGLTGLEIINVENACASAASSLHGAWLAVASGYHDCVLAVGAEKMSHPDKRKVFDAFYACVDIENKEATFAAWAGVRDQVGLELPVDAEVAAENRSVFMDVYAAQCHWHMGRFGSTQHQLAVISAKNHNHAVHNPKAQIKKQMSVEDVLNSRIISWPLTLAMCSPIGDGAAAALVCSEDFLRKSKAENPKVRIRSSVLMSGTDRDLDGEDVSFRASNRAYEMAGVGPEDIDTAEVHDATAYGELHQVEALGFCPLGEGGRLAESGETALGGQRPINPSGGLECRGHPVGATGLAQIYELVMQLRGQAGKKQVVGARLALAQNGGGNIGYEEAAVAIHILEKA